MNQYDPEMADQEKPRMGRPPRTGAEAAGEIITVRVTAAERAAWIEAAGDQPLAAWIRDRCNRAAKR